MSGARILLVDDDSAILRVVGRALQGQGYDVDTLSDGSKVRATVEARHHDIVLLDLMLPDTDGIELCRAIRPISAATIILLSAVGDEAQKVRALDEGADDYITKPFGMEELLARVRAALRRQGTDARAPELACGPIHLNLASREVVVDGSLVHLTPREHDLLRLLLEQQGRVLTQRFILSHVWGPEYADDSHILRTFVHQLRQKLAVASPAAAALLITDPGVGYRLSSES
jgi:two-component system KDP operon response regulator KdpE